MPSRLQQEKWFLLGLFLSPFLAWLNPAIGEANGPLHTEILSPIAIGAIFFLSGLNLHFNELWQAAANHRLNWATQLFCFVIIPFLTFSVAYLILPHSGLSATMIMGTLLMSCMPITTSSCVIFTSIAGGDTTATLFNATLSNIIGVFIAPIALSIMLSMHIQVDPWPMIGHLFQIIILPLLLGQLTAHFLVKWGINEHQMLYNRLSKWFLVFLIYAAFCQNLHALETHSDTEVQLVLILTWVVLLHLLFLGAAYILGRWMRFDKKQFLSFLLTAAQKTVVVGIPLNVAMLGDQGGYLLLPLLLYSNVQWLGSGLVVATIKE